MLSFFDIVSKIVVWPDKVKTRSSSSRKNELLSQEKIYSNALPDKSESDSDTVKNPPSTVS